MLVYQTTTSITNQSRKREFRVKSLYFCIYVVNTKVGQERAVKSNTQLRTLLGMFSRKMHIDIT